MSTASHDPEFDVDGAPISVLVDFDGTISLQDVGDELLRRHAPDPAEVMRMDRLYDEGAVGSRQLMRWDMDVLPRDPTVLLRDLESIQLDETLEGLVALVRSVAGAVEIVSDGLGFHIEPLLARHGLSDVPVATNQTRLGAGATGVTFPFGHPQCHACGTCKRERIRRHREAGRAVVFVGDGTSDRYAANHADVIFAKSSLATWCSEVGIAFEPWERLSDVTVWLATAMAARRLPSTPTAFSGWVRDHRMVREFICGPETWEAAGR